MTDDEIIKAMECCIKTPFCTKKTDCPYKGVDDCVKRHTLDAIDLINRQQAEIERLTSVQLVQANRIIELRGTKYEQIDVIHNLKQQLVTAKSEAVREFAKRLKEFCYTHSDITGYKTTVIDYDNIDYVAKEMIGEDNDKL